MPTGFEQLTSERAEKLIDTDVAFAGGLADKIRKEFSEGNPDVSVAVLPPVSLHRKMGPFKRRTRIQFQFVSNGHEDTKLLFGNRENFQSNKTYQLEALTHEAIVLVVGPSGKSGASLTVTAGSGEIIKDTNLGQSKSVKQIFIWLFPVIDPADMVGWYDPRQLAQTGVEVAVSTIFGRHSDHRLVEAMAGGEDAPFYDYSCYHDDDQQEICKPTQKRRESIWIDYVGDVGDGWNSTYAIAHYLALSSKTFKYSDGKTTLEKETRRGDILVFGGDEVYPTASREEYQSRLLVPYETALRNTKEPHPHVYVIPGNHDWYDSLVAFTRLFTSRRWFAGWRTRQTRSYFALKLPHNWWLLGTDVQLGSDIDGPQVEYFQKLSQYMEEERKKTLKPASIILCHAEPHWIRAWQYEGIDPNYSESNLKVLEKRLGNDVAIFIAGDLHHYRRHEARDGSTQKITAGGGGAFLHPTHVGRFAKKNFKTIFEKKPGQENLSISDVEQLPKDTVFDLKGCFPSEAESRRACWRNLQFPFFAFTGNKSWTFGFIIAVLYWLISLSTIASIDDPRLNKTKLQLGSIAGGIVYDTVNSSATLFFVVLTIIGFIFFTDTHRWRHRVPMGLAHALAHIFAAFTLAVLCVFFIPWPESWKLTFTLGGYEFHPDFRLGAASLLIMFGGFVMGSFIMGLYLLVSLNLFNRHGNEAFSSLGIEDWKNFLRMHIDESGNLTIYPIGIRRVPRHWEPRTSDAGPELVPNKKADPKATEPELIEEPILLKKSGTGTGVRAEGHAQVEIKAEAEA